MKGVIMAAGAEAVPFIKGLKLEKTGDRPFQVFTREGLVLILSGIGKVNAALASEYLILKFGTDELWNFGTAGGLSDDLKAGDILQVRAASERDRFPLHGKTDIPAADLIPGCREGVLSTGDLPVLDPGERKKLSAEADIADMEGAAVIRTCRKFGVKCRLFKVVSDTGNTPPEEIMESIRKSSACLYEFAAEKGFLRQQFS